MVIHSLVFAKSINVGENDVLVRVYADGRQAGVLTFTKDVWEDIAERGGVQIYLAEKYGEARDTRHQQRTEESGG
jgi:hypothetical protein